MTSVIRIVDTAIIVPPNHWARKAVGFYVAAYDPDGNGGAGEIVLTLDPAQAHKYADNGEAMKAWRAASSTHPVRDDGHPNRPLTAWTVSVEEFPGSIMEPPTDGGDVA